MALLHVFPIYCQKEDFSPYIQSKMQQQENLLRRRNYEQLCSRIT